MRHGVLSEFRLLGVVYTEVRTTLACACTYAYGDICRNDFVQHVDVLWNHLNIVHVVATVLEITGAVGRKCQELFIPYC